MHDVCMMRAVCLGMMRAVCLGMMRAVCLGRPGVEDHACIVCLQALKAAAKLQEHQVLWSLAQKAMLEVDPQFASQYTALAVRPRLCLSSSATPLHAFCSLAFLWCTAAHSPAASM